MITEIIHKGLPGPDRKVNSENLDQLMIMMLLQFNALLNYVFNPDPDTLRLLLSMTPYIDGPHKHTINNIDFLYMSWLPLFVACALASALTSLPTHIL